MSTCIQRLAILCLVTIMSVHPTIATFAITTSNCPCLPRYLCPSGHSQTATSATAQMLTEWADCASTEETRCCGVSQRGFIGMFADPAAEDADRLLEASTESVEAVLRELGVQEVAEQRAELVYSVSPTEHTQPKSVYVVYAQSAASVQNDEDSNEQIATSTLPPDDGWYTSTTEPPTTTTDLDENTTTDTWETTTSSAMWTTTTEWAEENATTTTMLAPATEAPVTTTTTTTTTSVPSITTNRPKPTTSGRNQFDYSATRRQRPRFQPRTIGNRNQAKSSSALPKIESIRDSATTAQPKPLFGLSSRTARRQRLFSADNRVNRLRKVPHRPDEEVATSTTTTTSLTTTSPTPEATTTKPVTTIRPRKLPARQRLRLHVDNDHRVMIEQVRSMLSQDAERHIFVPVESAFSTMAVAAVAVATASNSQATAANADHIVEQTSPPPTTSSTTESSAIPERPFRGRQRFRTPTAKPRAAIDDLLVSSAVGNAQASSIRYYNLNRPNLDNQHLVGQPRHARRAQLYDEDGGYMLSGPPTVGWADNWLTPFANSNSTYASSPARPSSSLLGILANMLSSWRNPQ